MAANMHCKLRPISLKKQVGSFMLELGMALIIAALAAAATLKTNVHASRMQYASFQGDSMEMIRSALNIYTSEKYAQLQFGQPVTKNGVTLANGNAAGQSFNPTIANLIAMNYLPAGFSAQGSFSNGQPPGNYAIRMQLTPAGCAPNLCDISGIVYLDQPIRAAGSMEPDGPAMSAIATRMGANGGFSLLSSPNQIVGVDGAWTEANPVAGTPPGVVAGRFGTTSSGLATFVRMNDTRDPNLQGQLTVAGQISSATSVGTTDGVAGCLRAALQNDGQILARSPDCVIRAFMNPNNGTIGVNNAAGSTTVLLDGTTGQVTATNVATQNLTATGAANVGSALITTSATPGTACLTDGNVVRDSSSSTSSLLICRSGTYISMSNASGTGTPGSACSEDGQLVKDSTNYGGVASTRVLICRGGLYRTVGLTTATPGASCATNSPGQLAESSTGAGLICRNNFWVPLDSSLGNMAFMDAFIVGHGANVAKPSCGNGGTPKLYLVPRAIDALGYVNHYATDNGALNWMVRIEDGMGVGKNGYVIAETYCYYGT